MAGLGAATLQVLERPVVEPLAELVERRRCGLLKLARLPAWVEVPLAIVPMDYTLYLWHVLTHRVPWLWRFHRVHHADLDLDAATAVRFHFGELALSVPWRAAQVLLIGTSPRALSIWQTATIVSILFHHSNLRRPIAIERALNRVIVTPRMHGIHHSIVEEETNSNSSNGLAFWDRLHGTLRLNVPQEAVTIGLPAYRRPAEVTLGRLLVIPFGPKQPDWRAPGDARPKRGHDHADHPQGGVLATRADRRQPGLVRALRGLCRRARPVARRRIHRRFDGFRVHRRDRRTDPVRHRAGRRKGPLAGRGLSSGHAGAARAGAGARDRAPARLAPPMHLVPCDIRASVMGRWVSSPPSDRRGAGFMLPSVVGV
jgi:sterol desaturase/sphingolipid hydroxylase (fatty acid hydroxylase superfamily)